MVFVDFVAVFEDGDVFHAGGFVDFLADGDADDEVAEAAPTSPTPSNRPGFAQSGSSLANPKFSNDWKKVFPWLEHSARFFQ